MTAVSAVRDRVRVVWLQFLLLGTGYLLHDCSFCCVRDGTGCMAAVSAVRDRVRVV